MQELIPATDCWFLSGATAVGKTELGITLAEQLGAEIIALDSMTIYRGMDIGTAKPSQELRERVPHHLIDVVEPDEEYSIDRYLAAAQNAIAEIRGRGKEILFVGGTPLYLKALLRGLESGPPADWEVRAQIEAEVGEIGNQALYERLEQLDPVAASQIHPNDTRRLIRAVEVFRATGKPISHHQMHFDHQRGASECKAFVLQRPREEQYERINLRVDLMIQEGLIEEVRELTSKGKQLGRTASQAVGYREAIEYLSGGSLELMSDQIKTRTRRFAKRQGTWFRNLSECRFLSITGEPCLAELTRQIIGEAA